MVTATAQLTEVEFHLIDPNPWQPRAAMDPEYIQELQVSMLAVGLLQEPQAREKDGRYQLAFGHCRVETLRGLYERGEWEPTVKLKIVDLTDEQMAYIALTENRARRNLTPAEEISAWAKVLKEVAGVTIQGLADKVGVDRTTMSKNLAILDLPRSVLDLVDAGQMSVRSAREFLALRNDDHCHEDQIQLVLKDLAGASYYNYADNKPPDYRFKTVRASIRGLARGRGAYGYPNGFDEASRKWRPLYEDGDQRRTVGFDVAAFKAENPHSIHVLPIGDESGGGEWTCEAKRWSSASAKATREANKAEQGGGTNQSTPTGPVKQSEADVEWWKVVKRDPVVKEVVGKRLRAMTSPQDLTETDIVALGTRVERRKGELIALPNAAQPEGVKLGDRDPGEKPPMFDFSQCASCINGATWYLPPSYYGDKPRLACSNRQAWLDKKSVGMQKWVEWRDQQAELDAQEDLEAIQRMPRASLRPLDAKALVISMWDFFGDARPVYPLSTNAGGGENRHRHDYWPTGATEFAKVAGLTLPDVSGDYPGRRKWADSAQEWANTAPDDFDWSLALACLQVWQARCALGIGEDIWGTVAAATGEAADPVELEAAA